MKSLGGIPVIRRGGTRVQDKKHTQLCYMTYVLNFPDGDQWVRQEQFSAHDLSHVLNNLIQQHARERSEWKLRAMALWKAGECWWKDEAGVEHLVLIEQKKRPERWGVSKEGMATFRHGVTGEELK